jgi:hypothetical protein
MGIRGGLLESACRHRLFDLQKNLPDTMLQRKILYRMPAAQIVVWFTLFDAHWAEAQPSIQPSGDVVSREVREITDRGLQYLVNAQTEAGAWTDGYSGPGTTGLAVMAFLASGEDPNFGRYALAIRPALRSVIRGQDSSTGYLGDSMYQHGFAMLALAEAYGALDETALWEGEANRSHRSIGEALELGVRCALTAQSKNPHQAWRYSPGARDADTSVSGAILMGLLAARNAGIEVPDSSIDKAIDYFSSMTNETGVVGYSGGMGGFGQSIARSSIACLVFSIAKRKDLKQYEATRAYITKNMDEQSHYVEYTRYYQAQALFQADIQAWEKWNRSLIRQLKAAQNQDGSFSGQFGLATTTSLNLLSLALNYRFLPIYER